MESKQHSHEKLKKIYRKKTGLKIIDKTLTFQP